MFLDTFHHSLDSKHRVSVPKKIIEAINDADQRKEFVISPGLEDGCLLMFTAKGFQDLAESMRSQWLGNDSNRRFDRRFFGSASRVALDSAGRMLIPERQRQSAGIQKEVTFVGCFDRIEVWAKERWESEDVLSQENFQESSKTVVRKDQD